MKMKIVQFLAVCLLVNIGTVAGGCTAGQKDNKQTDTCEDCPAGTYANLASCLYCPHGTYSSVGATVCIDCEDNLITLNTGSDNADQCVEGCLVADVTNAITAPVSGTYVAKGTTVVVTCSNDGQLPNKRSRYAYACEDLNLSVFC